MKRGCYPGIQTARGEQRRLEHRKAAARPRCNPELGARSWDFEISTDLSNEIVEDLAVPWHGGGFAIDGIDVHRVVGTFSDELATLRFKVLNEVAPFHAVILMGSRMTVAPAISSSAS